MAEQTKTTAATPGVKPDATPDVTPGTTPAAASAAPTTESAAEPTLNLRPPRCPCLGFCCSGPWFWASSWAS